MPGVCCLYRVPSGVREQGTRKGLQGGRLYSNKRQCLLGETTPSSAQCTSSSAVVFRTYLFSGNQENNFFKLLLTATGEKTTKDRNCFKAMKAMNPFVVNDSMLKEHKKQF